MNSVKLVAIVSSFNRLSLLKISLPSLVAAIAGCSSGSAIVVFDAGSTDGSKEWLERYCQQLSADKIKIPIDVIGADENGDSSFSAGVNAACQFAAAKYPQVDRFFFFETDNWISSTDPIELASALLEEQQQLGAAGFTVTKHSGQPAGYGARFPTIGQFILGTHLTHLLHLESPRPRWRKFRHVLWTPCEVVFTSPLLVRKAAWEATQGFDQVAFPFSDCDTDWCYRLKQAGWLIAVVDQKGVVHDNNDELSHWSSQRALQFHRARLRLLKRHNGVMVDVLKPLLFVRHCLECILLSVLVLLKIKPPDLLRARKQLLKTVLADYGT